ncbi:uncharacterized protein HaLaN_12143, partial [Haematococcus lacustris]
MPALVTAVCGRQRLHRDAEYRRGIDGRARNNAYALWSRGKCHQSGVCSHQGCDRGCFNLIGVGEGDYLRELCRYCGGHQADVRICAHGPVLANDRVHSTPCTSFTLNGECQCQLQPKESAHDGGECQHPVLLSASDMRSRKLTQPQLGRAVIDTGLLPGSTACCPGHTLVSLCYKCFHRVVVWLQANPVGDDALQVMVRNGLDGRQLAAAVATPLLVFSFLLASAAVLVYMTRQRQCHRTLLGGVLPPGVAPATTFLVTDIQDSTLLWEALPVEVMDITIALHHAAIRQCLANFCGYEVITEGDSFTIATHTPGDAVLLATHIQTNLMHCAWPEELLQASQCCCVWATPLGTDAAAAFLSPLAWHKALNQVQQVQSERQHELGRVVSQPVVELTLAQDGYSGDRMSTQTSLDLKSHSSLEVQPSAFPARPWAGRQQQQPSGPPGKAGLHSTNMPLSAIASAEG